MHAALFRSLSVRRNSADENDKGFTLIELLIVIVIIGILAAIAIPTFLGQQNSARDSAVRQDLSTAKLAVISLTTQGTLPSAITTTSLGANGYAKSGGTGAFALRTKSATSNDFCVQEVSASSTTPTFSATNETGTIASGACNATTYPTEVLTIAATS